jgi:hypothetical protein
MRTWFFSKRAEEMLSAPIYIFLKIMRVTRCSIGLITVHLSLTVKLDFQMFQFKKI